MHANAHELTLIGDGALVHQSKFLEDLIGNVTTFDRHLIILIPMSSSTWKWTPTF